MSRPHPNGSAPRIFAALRLGDDLGHSAARGALDNNGVPASGEHPGNTRRGWNSRSAIEPASPEHLSPRQLWGSKEHDTIP